MRFLFEVIGMVFLITWRQQFSMLMAEHISSSRDNITSLMTTVYQWSRRNHHIQEILVFGGLVVKKPRVLFFIHKKKKVDAGKSIFRYSRKLSNISNVFMNILHNLKFSRSCTLILRYFTKD